MYIFEWTELVVSPSLLCPAGITDSSLKAQPLLLFTLNCPCRQLLMQQL